MKGLVLNDTNLEIIEMGFGPSTDDAIGGQVILFVDPNVRFGGQRVGGGSDASEPRGGPRQ